MNKVLRVVSISVSGLLAVAPEVVRLVGRIEDAQERESEGGEKVTFAEASEIVVDTLSSLQPKIAALVLQLTDR